MRRRVETSGIGIHPSSRCGEMLGGESLPFIVIILQASDSSEHQDTDSLALTVSTPGLVRPISANF